MVRLTNEEIGQAKDEYEDRLDVIDGQLEDLRERLHKLYSALETGKLEVEDLAPRIKELREQIDDLEGKRLELVESIRDTNWQADLRFRVMVWCYCVLCGYGVIGSLRFFSVVCCDFFVSQFRASISCSSNLRSSLLSGDMAIMVCAICQSWLFGVWFSSARSFCRFSIFFFFQSVSALCNLLMSGVGWSFCFSSVCGLRSSAESILTLSFCFFIRPMCSSLSRLMFSVCANSSACASGVIFVPYVQRKST